MFNSIISNCSHLVAAKKQKFLSKCSKKPVSFTVHDLKTNVFHRTTKEAYHFSKNTKITISQEHLSHSCNTVIEIQIHPPRAYTPIGVSMDPRNLFFFCDKNQTLVAKKLKGTRF